MSYDEMEHYNNYKDTGHIRDRTKVLTALQPILYKKHQQLSGSLPDSAIKAKIARFAAEGIDNYDPNRGAKLSTHVFNHIAQASRMNYTYQNAVRMSEDKQQGKFKFYKKALDDLSTELNREPTDLELAARLGWTGKNVKDFKEGLFADIDESALEYGLEHSTHSEDRIRLNYIKDSLTDEEKKFFKDKTSGMNQTDMSVRHGMDLNKLNYTNRKLTDKIKGLLEKYDGNG